MVIRIKAQNAEQANGSTIFVGRVVHSKSLKKLEILHNAALGVRPDGTIAFLETDVHDIEALKRSFIAEGFNAVETVQLKPSQFLIPGLIDTHLHAPQWPNLALGMDDTLRDWMEKWTDPVEASYSDNAKARRVYAEVVAGTLRSGSTTVAYNGSIHVEATNILADACFRAGQRAIIGKMNVTIGSTKGNTDENPKSSLAGTETSIEYIKKLDPEGQLIMPSVQPRGGPYCPPQLMASIGDIRKRYNAHVQGHMCETQSDIDRTLQLHEEFDCYTDMYRHNGLLNERTIQAHCIHLTPKDFQNLKETRAGVAHNPNSNTCLQDGECRVRDLLDYGVKVGLGTDCSAGYMPSIHSAMRSASNVSRHLALRTGEDRYVLGFSEIVYLATMGGAEVLDMAQRIGNFERGKIFDALLVDTEDVIGVSPDLWESDEYDEALVKKWVFLGNDQSISDVYVAGRIVAGWNMRRKAILQRPTS